MNRSADEKYMRLAIIEAKKGLGRTSPNPCVGAVIVKEDRIIAKGYHKKAGTPHAEIHALQQATEAVAGATIYVTLEPCNHTGKTPPCTLAIIKSGISRVVVGMKDPNPLVNGSGIATLQARGISVTSGILTKECEALNVAFIKHITTGLPYVIMKAGVSLDGRLNYLEGNSGWITGRESVLEAHRLRDRVDAILVGSGTVKIDNPSLTTRIPGKRTRDPLRIILDSQLSTSLNSNVYAGDSKVPAWVFHAEDVSQRRIGDFQSKGIRLFPLERKNGGLHLLQLLTILGREGVCSVMVEGGAKLHGAFLDEKLFDYATLFYAPLFAGDRGLPLATGLHVQGRKDAPRLISVRYKRHGDDMMISGEIAYSPKS
ncbi:MAG: bifunctional diaminohydroxyphosphoribosylaminopyrimidine deaminase/5-amino-6-(5-phosphoribosylamino)uracil reductase RibD [Desulforhopalus sp.]|nr:bifunctional diaminohydroxyphosphoribosylaminopyrimidine deaminase/5-amino-6-(5-phosphoribosylamino)uracil reductase RibD [Desulforhopalus sp.]